MNKGRVSRRAAIEVLRPLPRRCRLWHGRQPFVTGALHHSRMRIALFSEVYWPMVSGVSLVLQRLAGALEQRGHRIRVYAPAYPIPGATDMAHVVRVPARRLFLYPDVQWGFPSWDAIRRDARLFRPDLVHVATEFAMGTTGLRLARELEIPVIASAHTDYERYSSRYHLDWLMPAGWQYLRWFYGQATRVLCPSTEFERHLQRRGISHTGRWTRGVDLEAFSPKHRSAHLRDQLGVGPAEPMVLYVGRLAAEKNLLLLVEAWRRLKRQGQDGKLVIVGTGPLEPLLRDMAQEGVVLAGVQLGEALSAYYASADLFAFPSSTETFGNVLLEAMASGLPSLAVDAGGVRDFVVHGNNAWLVEPESVGALATGLETLLREPHLRERLIAGAAATARARDWSAIFDDVLREYQRACQPSAGEAAA